MPQVSKSVEHLQSRLKTLQTEHRDLDEMLTRMSRDQRSDELQIRQLKKRKLMIKDTINELSASL